MRMSGTAEGSHAADIAQRNYAAFSGERSIDDQIAVERDPIRSAQLRQEKIAAHIRGQNEVYANGAAERRRIRESESRFNIEKDQADLSEAENDYNKQTKIFEEQWRLRISMLETEEEKKAARAARDEERQAREQRHAREIRAIQREGVEGYMRAAGRPELAGAIDEYGQIREDLRKAGTDQQQRAAIAFLARGRLQAEARGMIQAGVYGSSADYLQSAQASVLSGSSSVLSFLQKEYQGLGKVMHGGGDNELFAAGKALSDAAEKLGRQNLFVLKD
jgi:hypothetical protein